MENAKANEIRKEPFLDAMLVEVDNQQKRLTELLDINTEKAFALVKNGDKLLGQVPQDKSSGLPDAPKHPAGDAPYAVKLKYVVEYNAYLIAMLSLSNDIHMYGLNRLRDFVGDLPQNLEKKGVG